MELMTEPNWEIRTSQIISKKQTRDNMDKTQKNLLEWFKKINLNIPTKEKLIRIAWEKEQTTLDKWMKKNNKEEEKKVKEEEQDLPKDI